MKCNHEYEQLKLSDKEYVWRWDDPDPAHWKATEFRDNKIFKLFCKKCGNIIEKCLSKSL